jgi:hypothetical protein
MEDEGAAQLRAEGTSISRVACPGHNVGGVRIGVLPNAVEVHRRAAADHPPVWVSLLGRCDSENDILSAEEV